MTGKDFVNISANLQIAGALFAIAFLLLFIAFKKDMKKGK